jgi:hypothetical protein
MEWTRGTSENMKKRIISWASPIPTIKAEIDDAFYSTGIKIPDEDMAKLAISRDEFHGEWNYRLHPINNP